MKTKNLETTPLDQRLVHLFSFISSPRFLNKIGLGNEVPFFICPYDPKEAVPFTQMQAQLLNQLKNAGVAVLEINLYDLAIHLLQKRNLWTQILNKEPDIPKERLLELLQGVLDSATYLVPAIAAQMAEASFQVLFITGVGEVFPYIRSHNLLNNLQSAAQEQPTVLFFPGAYNHSLEDGACLDLFGKLHDDKYYRAFNIFHCHP